MLVKFVSLLLRPKPFVFNEDQKGDLKEIPLRQSLTLSGFEGNSILTTASSTDLDIF